MYVGKWGYIQGGIAAYTLYEVNYTILECSRTKDSPVSMFGSLQEIEIRFDFETPVMTETARG